MVGGWMLISYFRCPVLFYKLTILYGSKKDIKNITSEDLSNCPTCVLERDHEIILYIDSKISIRYFIENYFYHEVEHIFNVVFLLKGILLDSKNDELMCYYKQFIVKKIINKLKKLEEENDQ